MNNVNKTPLAKSSPSEKPDTRDNAIKKLKIAFKIGFITDRIVSIIERIFGWFG